MHCSGFIKKSGTYITHNATQLIPVRYTIKPQAEMRLKLQKSGKLTSFSSSNRRFLFLILFFSYSNFSLNLCCIKWHRLRQFIILHTAHSGDINGFMLLFHICSRTLATGSIIYVVFPDICNYFASTMIS